MSEAPRRFPLGLTFAALVAMTVMIGLGVWQLKRLAWKTDLLAHVEALKTAAPAPLGPVLDRLAEGGDVQFTRVVAECPGLARAPYLELYGLREGRAGSRLISVCPAQSARYRAILVDRGFVADTISARPPVDAADRTPLRLVGVLRAAEPPGIGALTNDPSARLWMRRDARAMAKALGAPAAAPVFLLAETSSNPEWLALTPAPLPAEIPNRHLEYALTWFGLAGALAAVYAALLWRRWKD